MHRRCDNPVLNVINNAVYHGLMIRAVVPRSEPLQVTPSAWIDIPGADAQGNWIPEETNAARRTLEHLQKKGVNAGRILVISPFRDTAYQIKKLPEDLCDIVRSGTIHTAQGKEADIVLLGLGGNPAKAGSRRWRHRGRTCSTSACPGPNNACTSSATTRAGRNCPTSPPSPAS